MNLKRLFTASSLALAVLASGAVHADAPPSGVRGAITAINGDDLQVKTSHGEDVLVHLTGDTQVRGVTLANIADIKQGSYVGAAAVPQDDGTLKALEVHVFAPSMAGTGDGHRAFDLAANSSMTNGSVGDLVVANGRTITVKYKGGEQKIFVPEDVPIVNLVPGDRSLLKPGVKVVLFAQKAADGSYTAKAISAGENGLKPPM
ncbi:DUF5666 domain-containing protein [Pseudomonas sp.]|uniref:DUF5666 domain-containing protein n=1 Tax=Pseudomonas sp. TaxID=306 RepID=UPI003CC56AE9